MNRQNDISIITCVGFSVLLYSAFGSSLITPNGGLDDYSSMHSLDAGDVILVPNDMITSAKFDNYSDSYGNEISRSLLLTKREKEILTAFIDDLVTNSVSMPAEYSALVDEFFDDLI